MDQLGATRGVIRGVGEVRAPDGTLRARFTFDGETSLSEQDLRTQLGLQETHDGDHPRDRDA